VRDVQNIPRIHRQADRHSGFAVDNPTVT
jgi:hypothetical protein